MEQNTGPLLLVLGIGDVFSESVGRGKDITTRRLRVTRIKKDEMYAVDLTDTGSPGVRFANVTVSEGQVLLPSSSTYQNGVIVSVSVQSF